MIARPPLILLSSKRCLSRLGPGLCLLIATLISGCADPQPAPPASGGAEAVTTPVSLPDAPTVIPGSNYAKGRYTAVNGTIAANHDPDSAKRIPAESEDVVIYGGHDNGSIGMWLEDDEEISIAPLRHVRENTYTYSIADHSGNNYDGEVTFLVGSRIYNELSRTIGRLAITKRITFRRMSLDEIMD
jgi:hypothetical protein